MTAVDIILPNERTPGEWMSAIRSAWQKSVEGILETGQLLVEAKNALPHGSFTGMVERELPFGEHMARRLMAIASDPRIANRDHDLVLPTDSYIIYQLTRLSDDEWEAARDAGVIRPDMQRKDIIRWRAEIGKPESRAVDLPSGHIGCTTHDLVEAAERGLRVGCIYADPPWLYGNQSTRAATGNHYGGMTVEEIAALPIEALCADNAHLHLWTTNAFLFEAKRVMESWGFEYKSVFVWVKPQMGIGNYWRVSHEFLLFGLRGKAPFAARDEMSWLESRRGTHSTKPERVRHKVERVSPSPRLELFARYEIDGWLAWGNQVEKTIFSRQVERIA